MITATLSLLFLLIGVHFVADYALQSSWMGKYKSRLNSNPHVPWQYVLLGHSFTHAMGVALVTSSVTLGILELICHFFIDDAKCRGKINIHTDQALHMLCKIVWCILWVWAVQAVGIPPVVE